MSDSAAAASRFHDADAPIDALIWQHIADSPYPQDFRDYLRHAPEGGAHVDEAIERLIELDELGAQDDTPSGDHKDGRYAEAMLTICARAKAGEATAQFHAGKMSALGLGCVADDESAIRWYRAAVLQGELRSHVNLATLLEKQATVAALDEVVKLLGAASAKGEGVATFNLGRLARETSEAHPTGQAAVAFEHFHRAWDQGSAVAGHWIGHMLLKGSGVREDKALGREWLVRAAEARCTGAILALARNDDNSVESARWFHRGAELGDPECQTRYAICLLRGEGVGKDGAQAVQWLKRAAVVGDAFAQRTLGLTYVWGVDVIRNATFGRKWLMHAAEQGDAIAAYQLARLVAKSDPPDLTLAFQWYQRAARAGDADAQCALGLIHWLGHGTPVDTHAARKWIHLASLQGSPHGLYLLGRLYFDGVDLPVDYVKGADCFRRAAHRGHGGAQAKLGMCYLRGDGVERDVAEGMLWLTRAVESGDAEANTTIGYVLRDGIGVDANPGEASKWFLAAAEQGEADGQFALALLYANGDGLRQDRAEAHDWMHKAAAQGHEDASRWLAENETEGVCA